MKYFILLFSAVFMFNMSMFAQEPCGQPALTKKMWEENPMLEKAFYQLQEMATAPDQLKDGEEDSLADHIFTIPVVFHVLHRYGPENISDEQIYDQMRIINEDYRKLNADITDVIPYYDTIAADTKIQFELASLDPLGNPTNGITRHYTHEAVIGDDFSKLEQWPRDRYLNVWISYSMEGGVAGYAYFPTATDGANSFIDGIMIRYYHIGSIGEGSPYNSRSLTHEIGHYLGLPHVWGMTNDPNVSANCSDDDGIEDTPNNIGSPVGVCNLDRVTCDGNPYFDTFPDPVQNYMDYSYCSNMFTKGQAKYMRNVLQSGAGQRDKLWREENLEQTVPAGIKFNPVPDFFANQTLTCVGNSVTFKNWTWAKTGNDQEYEWTFEDGGTSTDENPTVTFSKPGWKDVTLKVTQDGNTVETVTKKKFIYITPDWAVFDGVHTFNFEEDESWIVKNDYNYDYKWEVREDAGKDGSSGMFLNLSNPHENPTLFTPEFFFDERKGGSKLSFVSQPIDYRYVTDASVSFDWAAATNAVTSADMNDELVVSTSVDCGKTWQTRTTIKGKDIINNGTGWDSFYPNENTLWDTKSFIIPSTVLGNGKVLIRFEYTASDLSNNIAIDNVTLSGTVGLDNASKEKHISIYPNPSNVETGWNVKYDAAEWGGAQVELTDLAGRVITKSELPKNQTEWNVKANSNAAQGIYILKINTKDRAVQEKLILK